MLETELEEDNEGALDEAEEAEEAGEEEEVEGTAVAFCGDTGEAAA